MGTFRMYMKGKKLITDSKVFAEVIKTAENGRYDICGIDGTCGCSIYVKPRGFIVYIRDLQNEPAAEAYNGNIMGVKYGTFSGNIFGKPLIIDKHNIRINNQIVAKYSGANVGFGNAFLSAYTYLHQHIDIYNVIPDREQIVCIAIYAYLNYIRFK